MLAGLNGLSAGTTKGNEENEGVGLNNRVESRFGGLRLQNLSVKPRLVPAPYVLGIGVPPLC